MKASSMQRLVTSESLLQNIKLPNLLVYAFMSAHDLLMWLFIGFSRWRSLYPRSATIFSFGSRKSIKKRLVTFKSGYPQCPQTISPSFIEIPIWHLKPAVLNLGMWKVSGVEWSWLVFTKVQTIQGNEAALSLSSIIFQTVLRNVFSAHLANARFTLNSLCCIT